MRRTLAGSLLALLCSTAMYAQAVAGAGSITGIVRDQYGDGLPAVTLVITNPSLGINRSIMTSDEGLFNAPGLVPSSTYPIKVTKKGYEDWTLANFDVSVGETVNFRIPEGTLVITNRSLGINRSIMTSDEGLFNAPGLVPSSTYAIKVTKKGYEDWTLANFDVSVGETVNFRIPLVKAGSPPAGEPLSALAPVQDTKISLSA